MKCTAKYKLIEAKADKYSVVLMCRFFEVSRSGYYAFLKRRQLPDKDEWLAQRIAAYQQACRYTYGYRRIWQSLCKDGIHRNPKTILRVMNKYGLLCQVRRRKRYKNTGGQLHKYPNLLNRQFQANRPNEKWVTDISYIHTSQGVLYLSIIRDLFDNSIVAYKTSKKQSVSLVMDTIHLATQKQKVTAELLLHSDQGFQYTSYAYQKLTQQYGITPSMSRRGNCYDNAMAENFFSFLKTECIYRQTIRSFQQANFLIDEYIYFYNFQRIQLYHGHTPYEIRSMAA